MKRSVCLSIVACLALIPGTHCLTAGDWPHWRGPQRDGVVAEGSGWNAGAWFAKQPLWSRNIGNGGMSPLVVGGRLYWLGWKV